MTIPAGTQEKCNVEQVKYEDAEEKENTKPKEQKRSTQVCIIKFEVLFFDISFLLRNIRPSWKAALLKKGKRKQRRWYILIFYIMPMNMG